jgi:hypothetical protein
MLTYSPVMFLPLCLVMPTQMPRNRKIGVGLLFASGLLCTLFSTIRIVQLTPRDGKPQSPDPKWLTMWTIVECSTGTTPKQFIPYILTNSSQPSSSDVVPCSPPASQEAQSEPTTTSTATHETLPSVLRDRDRTLRG